MQMRKIILATVALLISFTVFSQDFSNKGKDFWVGYGYHEIMVAGNQQDMVLYFAADAATVVNVSIPALGYSQSYNVPANSVVTSIPMPKAGTQDARLLTEGQSDKGIHITADHPIVAYAHIYNSSVSGASILFPTNTLGKEYYSINYKNTSNSANANCWFYVVATDPGTTTVEITPSANTTGHTAGIPFTVNLTQGQVYNVMGQLTTFSNPFQGVDLTGSKIKSIASGVGDCKRIAVFSGSGRISITCTTGSSSSDNYMVQSVPKTAWGKNFLTSPTSSYNYNLVTSANNIYRVCVTDPATVVTVNGAPIGVPLSGGFYYEIASTNQPMYIQGSQAIMVAEYLTSTGACGNTTAGGNTNGDPEVIYLSPVEQSINKVLWNATPNFAILNHYFNVIIPNTGTAISSFKLLNSAGTQIPTNLFITHPGNPGYSYLKQALPGSGVYTIKSDSGFNAIAYGYGNAESYGFNAGTNVKDLYQQIQVSSQYGIETTPSVCTGSPFRFKVSLPYQPDSLFWNLSSLPASTQPSNNSITVAYPAGSYDSTTTVNGKPIYWYSLPASYTITATGTFPITITAYAPPSLDNCGTSQDIDFDLEVSAPPVAGFTISSTGCVGSPVQFNDATVSTKPTYKWSWDFGDPFATPGNNKSTLQNPVHTYSQPGNYTVTFSSITTPGCLSDTLINTSSVVITAIPVANFTRSSPVCEGKPVTFTDVSTVTAPGTISKWTWDFGDGNTTIATTASTASQVHTYTAWTPTTINASLIVETNSGCKSLALINTFKVNPNPVVDFQLPAGICLPGASQFSSLSTIADGTQSTFNYLWTFGDPTSGANNTSTINPTSHVYTAAPPTGGYQVKLKIISAAGCADSTTKAVVSVFPKPLSSFTAPAAVCTGTSMSFTSGVDPTTVSAFWWDFGDGSPAVNNGPTATVNHTYPGTGPYSVKHWIVSSNGCNSDTTIHSVFTTPVPVISNITHTNPTTCTGTDGTITLSGLVAGTSYTINYDKNSTPQTALVMVAGAGGTIVMTGLASGIYSNINVTAGCTSANGATQTLTDPAGPSPATANGTATLCAGGTISLTASTPIVGTITYAWTGPNGFTSALQNPTILSATVAASGNYFVTITVNNCTSAQSSPVAVLVNPTPVISSAVPTNPTTCGGADGFITINGLTAGTVYTINYQKNGTSQPVLTLTASAGGSVVIPNLTSGAYSSINVTAGGCPSANAATQSLNDPSAPAAPNATNTSSNSPVCAGGTLSFTTTPVAGAVYTWSGPSFNSALQNPSISNVTTAASGSYTLSISVNNCVSVGYTLPLVQINALPTANFTSSAPVCENKTISFTDASVPNSGVVNTWAWNFGDPSSGSNTSTIQNPTHTFATASGTPYQVTLTVTTDKGCTSTQLIKPITVAVNPVAGFTVPVICLNDLALFTDTSKIATGTIAGWAWTYGEPALPNNTSTGQNGSHQYSNTGSIPVKLVVTSNIGCKDSITQNIFINGNTPAANFSVANSTSICGGDSVAITNLSTVNPGNITKAEIFWDNVNFPLPAGVNYTLDNSPTLNKIYKHKYPSLQVTRNYTIRFRAYSGSLCVNDKFVVVTVNAVPKVQFNAIPNICYDVSPYQITQATETGGVAGSGTYTGPGVSPTGLFTAPGIGTYLIKYTYTSTAAGCTDTLSRTITVIDTASAQFNVSANKCLNRAITFTDASTAPVGTITSWTWDFADATGPIVKTTGAPFTHTYSATGTYNVTLKVTTSNGCKSTTRTIPVVVSPNPVADFSMPVACLPNANVTFTNLSSISDASALTYLWNFGDPLSGSNTSTGVNGTHIYNNNGPFTVSLLTTSAAGCDSLISKPYSDLHPQPTADFSIADPTGVCLGTGTTFTDNSTGADGIVTNWAWDLGDGSATINQTVASTPISYTYTDTLLYSIKLSIMNSFGCKNNLTKTFQVHAFPVVNAGPDRFVLEGGSVTLQPIVTGLDLTYLWLPATFMNDPTSGMPTVSAVTRDISYTLTATARGGCSASDIVFVKLLKFPVIPNTFTPNNDGINDVWSIDYLNTYPDNWVQVFNRYGQLVFESHGYSTPWNGTYKGKPLPIGTYYYIIEPKNGRAPLTGYVTIIK